MKINNIRKQITRLAASILVVLAAASDVPLAAGQASYYAEGELPIFRPFPKDSGRGSDTWRVRYFGPVGIGMDLIRPGMTMRIANVEKGSPADKTGKLKKDQIIESINGVTLHTIDPRRILGEIITRAEASDGVIDLKIKGEGNVRVQIPVMGSYSETWPVNCAKSDKIVRNLADLIAKQTEPSWGSVLFMLSTGEEKDLAVVRKWMQGIETIGGMNWEKGYKGIGLCEYYLRTGDQSVLPVIKKMTEELREYMYQGGWSGRGQSARFTYSTGSGQVHASGIHCLTFVLMARLCGVEVDEYMLNESLTQFYRFGGRGNVAYGNGSPEGGLRDNGKTSGLAVAMAVAAQLTPEGEQSVYAMARDNSAMKAFYATNWFHAAHTGGGMGEIWHHGAMALMREKRPIPYRSYHDTRRWVMELSRRHDGSIAIAGMDDRYNRSLTDATAGRDWGTYFALTYTYPRKALQIWGAPRSKWAKHYSLPDRPWGTPADDIFNSPDPINIGEGMKLTRAELLNEQVEINASIGIIEQYKNPDLTERDLFKHILHPEYAVRSGAMNQVVQRGWDHLVVPMLKSGDPRLRHAGLLAITGMFKGGSLSRDQLTDEMFDLVGAMIEDPHESWWVAEHAVRAIRRADPERVAQHRDRLLELLEIDNEWLQSQSILTLTKIAGDRQHYKAALPLMIRTSAALRTDSASGSTAQAIRGVIESAGADVKQFVSPILKETYAGIPPEVKDPGTGAVMRDAGAVIRTRIGNIIEQLPGGEEYVRRLPKQTLQSYISGKESDMFVYDGKTGPNPKIEGTWHWAVHPAPKDPGEIDWKVKDWISKNQGNGPIKLKNPKDTLVLEAGGKVSKSHYFKRYFWDDNMLASVNEGLARKMEVRTYDGQDFLIIEKEDFHGGEIGDGSGEVAEDFHPGFSVYIRVE